MYVSSMAQLIRKKMIYAGVGAGLHVTTDASPRVVWGYNPV